MFYFIWIIILIFFLFAYLLSNDLFNYIALGIWFFGACIKGWEKIGNYKDWCEKSKRDEKNKLEEVAEDMAQRGLTLSGIWNKKEKELKENFEYERRIRKRKFIKELYESLILK